MENNSKLGILGSVLAVSIGIVLYFSNPKQRVYIKNISDSTFTISDTLIVTDKCRFYYLPDSSYSKNIRISIYKKNTPKPYITKTLIPKDYIDLSLEQGKQIIHLNSLGSYPFINKRIKITKINEKK